MGMLVAVLMRSGELENLVDQLEAPGQVGGDKVSRYV